MPRQNFKVLPHPDHPNFTLNQTTQAIYPPNPPKMEPNPLILSEVIHTLSRCRNRSKGLTVPEILERVKYNLKYPDKLNRLVQSSNVFTALLEGINCGIIGSKKGHVPKYFLGPKLNRYEQLRILRQRADQLKREHCSRCKRSKKKRKGRKLQKRKRSKAKRRRRITRPLKTGSTSSTSTCYTSPTAVSSEEPIKDRKKKLRDRTKTSRIRKCRDSSEDSQDSYYDSDKNSFRSSTRRNKRRKKNSEEKTERDSSSMQSSQDEFSDSQSKEIVFIKKPK